MKYEQPNMEIILLDDIYTIDPLGGLGNSSDEGTVDPDGFPI